MPSLKFPLPFEHIHPSMETSYEVYEKRLTLGQRAADWVAGTVGSWGFILIQGGIVVVWTVLNIIAWGYHWDPYPFIFLNLVFSLEGAYTAPLIMMSQNRQDEIDRIDAHNDYLINQKVEEEIHHIMDHLEAQNVALATIHQTLEAVRKRLDG